MTDEPKQLSGAPRCGARTRAGTPCRCPAVSGKARCRMHGGAQGSGGQPENRNARKHGMRSKAWTDERRLLNELMREARTIIEVT
jgi:hypothetical protein